MTLSALMLRAISSAMTLMRENKHYFFLAHFYCTPTLSDKNESNITGLKQYLLSWMHFALFTNPMLLVH